MTVDLEFDYIKTTKALEKFSQKDIDELKQWTQDLDPAKCVPKDLSDKQIVLFYGACESDIPNTKMCIEKYYSCKKNAPEFFLNRNVTYEEVAPYLEAL